MTVFLLTYAPVSFILELGRFTQMVKLDLKSAYRILPIHPCSHLVLGVVWEGQVFIDHCLPFGLSSAPKIFTAFAVAWFCIGLVLLISFTT